MKSDKQKTEDILNFLIAMSEDKIWASELRLLAGKRRIDFWTLEPTASKKFRSTAHEIKVSRGDFRNDSLDKQRAAMMWSDRFWYVTPPGLISRDEIPSWSGLMEIDPDGDHPNKHRVIKRAPTMKKQEPSWDLVVSILRNTADRGRDVSLMKSQIWHLQGSLNAHEARSKMRQRYESERWNAKWQREKDKAT